MRVLVVSGLLIGLVASACSAGATRYAEGELGTESSATNASTDAAELAATLPPLLDVDAPFVAIWTPFGTDPDDAENRFFYAIAASSELEDLLEGDGSVVRAEMPLGVPPARYLGTSFAVWSADGLAGTDVEPRRSEAVTWPREPIEWPVPQPDDAEQAAEPCHAVSDLFVDPGAYGIVGDDLERLDQLIEDTSALREANASGEGLPDRELVARTMIGIQQLSAIISAKDSSCF